RRATRRRRARASPRRATRSRSWATGPRSPAARRRSPSTRTGYSVVVPIHGVRATRPGTSGTPTVMSRSNVVTRSLPALLFAVVSVLAACEPAQPQPDAVAKSYAEAWKKADYQKMWSLLSDGAQQRVGTDGFIDRLPRIAD